MFIAGLFAFGANVILSFTQIESTALMIGVPVLVNFCIVTFVLIRWEGLGLGQSAAVGAFTSVFYVLLWIGIAMVFEGAMSTS